MPPQSTQSGAVAWPIVAQIQAQPAKPTPPPNTGGRIRLGTISDVAKELRKLYREARAGVISSGEATKLAYLLNMLAQLLTTSDLEARLKALEEGQL